ncbi:hypothetical protein [Citrobacter freundii]|uniref:hypothetical protein n=1 Tax=Citrobacter freundii TaxID=546 RepID=UPI0020193B90|nr:hypothetical protein [Citrobacter freundii]MDH0400930.1 hypothetical protein [Citrobacter freundii]MDQ9469005.1 hypothetical protein [Citrobacter freundii]MEB1018593.1 hypothetical protein [Citrobacter freundii]UQQ24114.1 hypothetical protein LY266_15245 [Citrobacter freundii]HDS5421136.1 hypothetical protein [Citrobacter freundii]
MSTSADVKMIRLPAGMTAKPLYDKCPKCGCDLEKFYESENNQANTKNIKEQSDKRRFPAFIGDRMSRNSVPGWLNNFVHWMIHPLCDAKDYTSETDDKCFSQGVIGKQISSVEKDDESSNNDKNLVPGIKSKFR